MRNAMDRVTLTDLDYIERLHEPLSGVFAKMEEQGAAEHIPIVGTAVGRALHVLVRATGATRIVEVGTAIGYSALWMASAMKGGDIDTIDPDRTRTDRARALWSEAGVGARIRVHSGKAPGGLIVADNVLWSGRVSGSAPDDRPDDTRALREFNAAFVRHAALDATILPIGDGLAVGVRR